MLDYITLIIDILVLLNKKITIIIKSLKSASAILISIIKYMLICILRPYITKVELYTFLFILTIKNLIKK